MLNSRPEPIRQSMQTWALENSNPETVVCQTQGHALAFRVQDHLFKTFRVRTSIDQMANNVWQLEYVPPRDSEFSLKRVRLIAFGWLEELTEAHRV